MEKVETFFSKEQVIDRALMHNRIKSTTSALGWQETAARVIESGKRFEDLRIAEVGCGTGTFSLTLNILGTKCTLIDADEDALDTAREVFALYGRDAEYTLCNVLSDPSEHLRGQFDIVISGGLAEHFTGEDRLRCFKFHHELCKEKGFVYIGVPNRVSLGYRMVRFIKELTGKWTIDCEIPYTYRELKRIASRVGYADYYVLGNATLWKDVKDYSYAFLAAIAEVLPGRIREKWRKLKHSRVSASDQDGSSPNQEDEQKIIERAVEQARNAKRAKKGPALKNVFSAGIILFGGK